jgi:hypothetical protein
MTALPDVNGNTVLTALHPNNARTATGQGGSIPVSLLSGIGAVVLDCAAGTGTTPTLDITIQDSPDGSTGWTNIPGAVFTQVTTTASQQKIGVNWNAIRPFARVSWTIGGTTPSFQFCVVAVSRPEV